jgi:hypothetical protein
MARLEAAQAGYMPNQPAGLMKWGRGRVGQVGDNQGAIRADGAEMAVPGCIAGQSTAAGPVAPAAVVRRFSLISLYAAKLVSL